MKTTIVRYKLKAGRADENRQYVSKVFAELDNSKPNGLRYVSFQLDDGLSFVHAAVVESDDGKNPLPISSDLTDCSGSDWPQAQADSAI
jgi:hypothetical protein